ncbi:hypothetical protein L210DRAFT_81248 [Boletus edulis BED1]|uniref:Uncharacterized protein n=1 Tax=Boletus edulis BED1 TaxID=1328754 RepID=A0AAD4BGP1_BOLED|nr:hypothetical protein L210DRAFT_81248 [Boletus edulis BED1]
MTVISVVGFILKPGSARCRGRIPVWTRPCLRWHSWTETRIQRWRVARITRTISKMGCRVHRSGSNENSSLGKNVSESWKIEEASIYQRCELHMYILLFWAACHGTTQGKRKNKRADLHLGVFSKVKGKSWPHTTRVGLYHITSGVGPYPSLNVPSHCQSASR